MEDRLLYVSQPKRTSPVWSKFPSAQEWPEDRRSPGLLSAIVPGTDQRGEGLRPDRTWGIVGDRRPAASFGEPVRRLRCQRSKQHTVGVLKGGPAT